LDTFFNGGTVTLPPFGSVFRCKAIKFQSDDKIVFFGTQDEYFSMVLVRYTDSGVLDTTFGTSDGLGGYLGYNTSLSFGGAVSIHYLSFYDAFIQVDDTLVIAAYCSISGVGDRFFVGSYLADGSVLNTVANGGSGFGTNDQGYTYLSTVGTEPCIAPQSDGGFIVSSTHGVYRLQGLDALQGFIDRDYSDNGFNTYPTDTDSTHKPQVKALQTPLNGSVVVVTENLAGATKSQLVQLGENSGVATSPIDIAKVGACDVVMNNAHKTFVIGTDSGNGWIASYAKTGTSFPRTFVLDSEFNTGEIVVESNATSFTRVGVLSSGKVIVMGQNGVDGVVICYNSDGTIDSTFATNGIYTFANTVLADMVIGSDDGIYVTYKGLTNIELCKIESDGSGLDASYASGYISSGVVDTGLLSVDYDDLCIALDTDSKIIFGVVHATTGAINLKRYTTAGDTPTSLTILQATHGLSNFVLKKIQSDFDNKPVFAGYDDNYHVVGRLLDNMTDLDRMFAPYSSTPGMLKEKYSLAYPTDETTPARITNCLGVNPSGSVFFAGYENIDSLNTVSFVARVVGGDALAYETVDYDLGADDQDAGAADAAYADILNSAGRNNQINYYDGNYSYNAGYNDSYAQAYDLVYDTAIIEYNAGYEAGQIAGSSQGYIDGYNDENFNNDAGYTGGIDRYNAGYNAGYAGAYDAAYGVAQADYDSGYAAGQIAGSSDGYIDGYEQVVSDNDAGYTAGTAGYDAGYNAGYAVAYDIAYLNGQADYDAGYAAGQTAHTTQGYDAGYGQQASDNDAGYTAGTDGYNAGYNAGYAAAYDAAYINGNAVYIAEYNEGFQVGFANGFTDGINGASYDDSVDNTVPYNQGYEDGYPEGYAARIGFTDLTFATSGVLFLQDVAGVDSGLGTPRVMYVYDSGDNAGKILIAIAYGSDTTLLKLNSDYTADTSFGGGTGAIVVPNLLNPTALQVDFDGNILVSAGTTGSGSGQLQRVLADGSGVDLVFASPLDNGYVARIQSLTRIVLAGRSSDGQGSLVAINSVDGSVDETFGSDGYYKIPSTSAFSDAVVYSNNHILVAYKDENDNAVVQRVLPEGSTLDDAFVFGTSISSVDASTDVKIALDKDDKIIVVARNVDGDFVASRYGVDGADDVGPVTITLSSDSVLEKIVTLSDGSTLILGYDTEIVGYESRLNLIVIRLNSSFVVDETFRTYSSADYSVGDMDKFTAIDVVAGPAVIVVGHDATATAGALTRLISDVTVTKVSQNQSVIAESGTLDATLGTTGIQFFAQAGSDTASLQVARAIALKSNNNYVVALDGRDPDDSPSSRIFLNLFNTDGQLDTDFGTDGQIQLPTQYDHQYVKDMVVFATPAGIYKAIIAGYAASTTLSLNSSLLMQFDFASASLDNGFGGFYGDASGTVAGHAAQINTVARQSSGRIIAGGEQADGSGLLLGYSSLGHLDKSFGVEGYCFQGITGIYTQVVDSSDNIVIAYDNGSGQVIVARVLADGSSLDGTFNNGGTPGYVATGISGVTAIDQIRLAIDSLGRILVAAVNNAGQDVVIKRYEADGSSVVSQTIAGATDIGTAVTTLTLGQLLIDENGKAIIVGSALDADGSWMIIVRTTTGITALDSTFNSTGYIKYQVDVNNTSRQLFDALVHLEGRIIAVGNEIVDIT